MRASPYSEQHIQIRVCYKMYIPSFTPIPSLDVLSSGLSFFSFCFGGFFVFLFLELLSLLVINVCKHCHYQPQYSLSLTLWYMHSSLQCANKHQQSQWEWFIATYMTEKNIAEVLQDQKIRPCMKSEDRSFWQQTQFFMNWLCEGSTGLPKKDIIMDTFFLLDGNTIGR